MSKSKFMYLDREEGRFVKMQTNNVVNAIYTAWNYEYPVYEVATELCIFEPYADNEDNSEMLEEYGVRVVDDKGRRKLQTISTGEIHKAPWEK